MVALVRTLLGWGVGLACLGCAGEEFTSSGAGGALGGAGAGGVSGAGATGGISGSGGTSSCGLGTVSGIVDDFTDGVVAPGWTLYGSIVSEDSGEATVKFTPDTASETAGYKSSAPLSFKGCAVLAALHKVPAPEAPAAAFFSVSSDDALTYVELAVYQGTLRALVKVGGNSQSEKSGTYDSTDHAWLRLRDSAGTTSFETSNDGNAWVPFHSAATPSEIESAHIDFGGMSWGAHNSPGEVRFDDLNRPP